MEVEPGVTVVNPTVTWNPSSSPASFTITDWNRGFELGALTEWTAVDAEISAADPYEGDYCCNLTKTDASITQTLDEPVPVNAVYAFNCWLKKGAGTTRYQLRFTHADGSTQSKTGYLTYEGWILKRFERRIIRTEYVVTSISIISSEGQIFVDDVFLGLAGEIVTGAVEVSQAFPRNLQAEVLARPMGGVLDVDSVTTTAAYATVASYKPPNNYRLELSKILVSCPEDVMYQLWWGGEAFGAEVYVTGGIPFTDWFPWNYKYMEGDGTKEFELKVKYPTGGAAAVCHAEVVGEEMGYTFNY